MQFTTHKTQQPRQSLNKRLSAIAVSGVLTLSALAAPAHAGVIDQIKSRVDAIKSDTSNIKSRTGAISAKTDQLMQRAEETAMTVNSVIAETDIIKSTLAPLQGIDDVFANVRGLKSRFAALQFEPLELLQNPQLQDAIEQLKRRQEEMQQLLNDPDVETFRAELLTLLEQIKQLKSDGVPTGAEIPRPEPLEALVANGPRLLVAVLKVAMETEFQPIRDRLGQLAQIKADLQPMIEDFALGTNVCDPYSIDPEAIWVNALRGQKLAAFINRRLSKVVDKVPSTGATEFGIHGYASFEVDISQETKEKIQKLADFFDNLKDQFELVREVADHCSP